MKKRQMVKRTSAIGLTLLLAANLFACQNQDNGDAAVPAETEQEAGRYHITEENQNKELVMNHQPESSYWFPEELLAWNPEEDEDLAYNISTVPLAKRVEKENLTPVNKTQSADTRVMAISIMNSSTSGNAPHGLNSVNCNIFTYWQYVDELVYWGGSSGEGLIVPPSPDVTDLGHKNGVPVIGTVFFPQGAAGGKMEWLDTFLSQEKDGSFPLADRLIEVAEIYGFDGWFINQETEGTEEELADQKLLEQSAELAGTHTSLGIYCPSWAYASASTLDDFHQKENTIWVNSKRNPAAVTEASSPEQWRGVSAYVIEKSAVTELPFITNFNTGSGYSFYKEGEQISTLDWNNRSIGDILPTYRWMIDQEENSLEAAFDVGNAWYGGTSLKLYGKVEAEKTSVIHLYSADLPIAETTAFSAMVKATAGTELSAVLAFDDGSQETFPGDQRAGEEWTKVTFDISKSAGRKIRRLSFEVKPLETAEFYQINFGNITVSDPEIQKPAKISSLTIDEAEFDEDGMYAGVRLSWDADGEGSDYEVYRVNQDKTLSLLGVSNTECFYINTLPRTDEANKSEFQVIPVNGLLAGTFLHCPGRKSGREERIWRKIIRQKKKRYRNPSGRSCAELRRYLKMIREYMRSLKTAIRIR